MLFTENNVPVKSSVIENNWPCEPWISTTVDPDLYTNKPGLVPADAEMWSFAVGVVVPIPTFAPFNTNPAPEVVLSETVPVAPDEPTTTFVVPDNIVFPPIL